MLDEAKSFDDKPATWADMMGRLVDGKNPKPYQKNEWPRPDIKKLFLPFIGLQLSLKSRGLKKRKKLLFTEYQSFTDFVPFDFRFTAFFRNSFFSL